MRSTRLVPVALIALIALASRRSIAEDAKPAPPPASPPAPAAAPVPPGPEIAVPRASGLVLDGAPSEDAWKSAATIAADTREGVTPVVKVLASAARLWIAVEVAENPGEFVGIHGFIAPDGTKLVAETIQVSFGPQNPRNKRIDARGPRGVGRAFYRYAGAADLARAGAWTAEASIPFEDLGLPTDACPIRLAVVVSLRKPNLFAPAPPAAAFSSINALALMKPPEGGWAAGEKLANVDAEKAAMAAEDAADQARVVSWQQFRNVANSGAAAGPDGLSKLLQPLDAAIAARPDLAFLRRVKAKVIQQVDGTPEARERARTELLAAVAAAPGIPESKWDLALLDVSAWAEPTDNVPTDYEAAFAKIAEAAKSRGPDDPAVLLASAILRHKRGDFAEAAPLFDAIVNKYPIGEDTSRMARDCRRYAENFAIEMGYRLRDTKKGDLPRARVKTLKGDFVLELFEDDAPNTVANFVYLARAKFYDGTLFHRVVPFFMCQGGDPLSKTGHVQTGEGGPGYAIPTEIAKQPRLPFRGVAAMASTGKNTEGSQFFVTTATSSHLEGNYSVFGRVLEGQDVVEKVVRGDTIVSVTIETAREHVYHPTTVSGKPAPEPKATAPERPKLPPSPAPTPGTPSANPHIVVDHILIGVRSGSFPQGKRDAAEAKQYADALLAKLKSGGDWEALKKENSEDGAPGRPGGPYAMADRGVTPAPGESPRDRMVPAFGNVGFRLAVGEMGLAEYDATTSPFGYHIIKRVK